MNYYGDNDNIEGWMKAPEDNSYSGNIKKMLRCKGSKFYEDYKNHRDNTKSKNRNKRKAEKLSRRKNRCK